MAITWGSYAAVKRAQERGRCADCGLYFTDQEWDQRHSDSDGEDVHEDCCDVCHGDDTDHRVPQPEESDDPYALTPHLRPDPLLEADNPPPAPDWFDGDGAYGWACGWSYGFLAALRLIDGPGGADG